MLFNLDISIMHIWQITSNFLLVTSAYSTSLNMHNSLQIKFNSPITIIVNFDTGMPMESEGGHFQKLHKLVHNANAQINVKTKK